MTKQLAGKVAIVTGAGNGIGAATARRFAQEGARVVCADLDAAASRAVCAEIVAAGGVAAACGADVRKAEDVEAMIAFTLREFGPPNIASTMPARARKSIFWRRRSPCCTRCSTPTWSAPSCARRRRRAK